MGSTAPAGAFFDAIFPLDDFTSSPPRSGSIRPPGSSPYVARFVPTLYQGSNIQRVATKPGDGPKIATEIARVQRMQRVKVLSLSTVFPNPAEENLGPFVRHRLQNVARLHNVEVVAPIALIDYAERRFRKSGIPVCRQDGPLRIHHPRSEERRVGKECRSQ